MIGYFPEPYPDELFYSLCARFGERMRYPHKSTVMRELLGAEGTVAVVDFPSRLGFFMEALPPGHPLKAVAHCDPYPVAVLWPIPARRAAQAYP